MKLVINNLTFSYGRISAIAGIEARADSGRLIAVLGPNASGKSTLLRCIIGALRPSVGSVMLDGLNVHRLSTRALAKRIAYVPQRSIVSAAFTVRQVIELGRYALPADGGRVRRAMDALDLADVCDRPYRALSIGQQQRVSLARAMAQLSSDGLLVLDEPTAAMDLEHAALAYRLLREAAGAGATVLIAMHDLTTAATIADDVWLLHRGRLAASGTACEVLEPDRLRDVFKVGFAWVNDQSGRARLLADALSTACPTGSE